MPLRVRASRRERRERGAGGGGGSIKTGAAELRQSRGQTRSGDERGGDRDRKAPPRLRARAAFSAAGRSLTLSHFISRRRCPGPQPGCDGCGADRATSLECSVTVDKYNTHFFVLGFSSASSRRCSVRLRLCVRLCTPRRRRMHRRGRSTQEGHRVRDLKARGLRRGRVVVGLHVLWQAADAAPRPQVAVADFLRVLGMKLVVLPLPVEELQPLETLGDCLLWAGENEDTGHI